jgi:hypothetical protein
MTLSISCRIMDALAALLQGTAAEGRSDIPDVEALFLDAARVATFPDGVVISLDQSGQATDEIGTTCRLISTLPVVVSIQRSRVPNDPPNWQLLDPFYVAVHARIMGSRTLGGLSIDIESVGRTHEADLRACLVRCLYTVKYQTSEADVTAL